MRNPRHIIYDTELQFIVGLLRDVNLCGTYAPILPESAFGFQSTQLAYRVVVNCWRRIQRPPGIDSFINEFENEVVLMNQTQINADDFGSTLAKIVTMSELSPIQIDYKIINDQFIKQAKSRLRHLVATDYNDERITDLEAEDRIRRIMMLGEIEETATFDNRLSDWANKLESYSLNYTPTLFPTIDNALNGGVPRSEYIMILGYANSGKSFIAINIGFAALLYGKRVLHVSTENSVDSVAERYALRTLGINKNTLKQEISNRNGATPGEAAVAIMREHWMRSPIQKDVTENLHINFMGGLSAIVGNICAKIENIKASRGYDIDVVIVDGIDDLQGGMGYNKFHNEEQRLTESSKCLLDLACQKNITVWCTGQMKSKVRDSASPSLGTGESRSHRAKTEIPSVAFWNMQSAAEKEPDIEGYRYSRLHNLRSRNFEIIHNVARLRHAYKTALVEEIDDSANYRNDPDMQFSVGVH